MICPYCGAENIEGVDDCGKCGEALSDTHLHEPATTVERCLLADHIDTLAPKTPVAVAANTPVRDVLRTMVERRIGCLIVAEGGKPVGVFSERDALTKLHENAAALGDRPVADFMTAHPETLQADAKVAFAVQRMDVGGYRHIPIVDRSGALTGIISVRDILDYLTEKLEAEP